MIISSNSINQVISVMVMCCILFAIRTEYYLHEIRLQGINNRPNELEMMQEVDSSGLILSRYY